VARSQVGSGCRLASAIASSGGFPLAGREHCSPTWHQL